MIRKVIFILNTIFDKRDYQRFCINKISKYFLVKIYCLTTKPIKLNLKKKISINFVKNFKFVSSLNYKDSLVIDLTVLSIKNLYLKYLLKKKKIKYIKILTSYFPQVLEYKKGLIARFLFRLLILKKENILEIIINKFVSIIENSFFKPYFIISGGDFLKKYYLKKNIHHCNLFSFDYDNFKKVSRLSLSFKKKYCVFIDSGILGNRDFAFFNVKPIVEEKEYKNLIDIFFNIIEKKYNIKVIIAGHPKSDKKKNVYLYGPRKVFYNKTPELIKNAKFVMMHKSTAVSYAVLFSKPILFLTTNQIEKNWYGNDIKYLSNLLKSTYINLDKNFEILDIKKKSLNKYKKYQLNYIKSKEIKYQNLGESFVEIIKKIK